jgi:hypothetical protein
VSNATGRPTTYTDALGDSICERLMDGESLKSICAADDMPHRSTVFRWIVANETFRDMYARAREEQAETMADEIVSIADEGETKVIVGGDGASMVVFDSTAVARNRLRVDARKWVAAKLKPRKYGDKLQTEISGPDGGPVETVTKIVLEAG